MGWVEAGGWGLFGACLPELLALYRSRSKKRMASPSIVYWSITLVMIAAGGGITIAYFRSGFDLNPLLALNIGASAPLIIGSLVNQVPEPDLGPVD
jgi:hypothetical protein